MNIFDFIGLDNIQRIEGLVLGFSASVCIDGIPHLVQCSSGGNSIYVCLSNRGIRLCFAANKLEEQYIHKIKLIAKILPQYVPKIHEIGTTVVRFSRLFEETITDFIAGLDLPKWLIEKYNLLDTIKEHEIKTPWISTEHLESINRYDPLHSKIRVEDLKEISLACLNCGIYMGFVPRLSNVINTKDGIKYLDFDEWVIIDNERFSHALIKNNIT